MAISFQVPQLLAGFVAETQHAQAGDPVSVIHRELVGPANGSLLLERLESLQGGVFGHIPGLPPPSAIDHLVVILRKDLSGVAYVNELRVVMTARAARDITAGEMATASDISDIVAVDLGVDVPPDAGVIVVRSWGWRRSLFYDLSPLGQEQQPRTLPIQQVLATQALLLLGLGVGSPTRFESCRDGFAALGKLLDEQCSEETQYQELLEKHPWMFGGEYSEVCRHTRLDDRRIPDFTGVRCYDGFHDVFELKQPFLGLFKQNGQPSAAFNDAWNQAEAYLDFARQQRMYLREEKKLSFENPRAILIAGYRLTEEQQHVIRRKERSGAVRVMTFDHLLRTAGNVLDLMRTDSMTS